MCTVTWRTTPEGYDLFFSRDELRSRSRAQPPEVRQLGHLRAIAPVDPDGGGTWLATNEAGLSVGLLNGHPGFGELTSKPTSRGKLVWDLAAFPDLTTLRRTLAEQDLSLFKPFTLLALEPGGLTVLDWNGEQVSARDSSLALLSSSSMDPLGALLARRAVLEASPDQDPLEFHKSHQPSRGPHSPCMHRSDARTVSFAHVAVRGAEVRWTYVDGPPCRNDPGRPIVLERA